MSRFADPFKKKPQTKVRIGQTVMSYDHVRSNGTLEENYCLECGLIMDAGEVSPCRYCKSVLDGDSLD
jgi:hypothetical protein